MHLSIIKVNVNIMIEQASYASDNMLKKMAAMDTGSAEYDHLCNLDAEMDAIKTRLNGVMETLELITQEDN